ncbi:MAG: MmgE/PrpD family protein [Candidatus Omnitrophica bacterium]|nr:MmgE/PrpD family protein [Candidatus Omnitrophota bacterium]
MLVLQEPEGKSMTEAEQLASFVARVSFEDISGEAREQLKLRLLDAIGCAVGAAEGEPVRCIREQINDFGGRAQCTLIGGGKTAPDRAALYNSALVRYLDFNDSYLAKGETCHPSDNLGAVLAAAEYADCGGRDFLTALAVAYQVQCRLSDVAPVRSKGFDHTTQGSYALAAGISKALGLELEKTANAIAICGTAFNALRVTRTGALSHWKGLAYHNDAFCCTQAAFLAMRGITGPLEVFEGNKGFKDSIAGGFEMDWAGEDLERVRRTILKKSNAEIHSQAAIEGALELQALHGFRGEDIESVHIAIFDVAYHIIGGGEEGDKTLVHTKEQADHSLPYMVAVALLDGQVLPPQYAPERIKRDDVQALLRRVIVRPDDSCSKRFPDEHACKVTIHLKSGVTLAREKSDYEGFHTRPMGWDAVIRKFDQLSKPHTTAEWRNRCIEMVRRLDSVPVRHLCRLLAKTLNQTERLKS